MSFFRPLTSSPLAEGFRAKAELALRGYRRASASGAAPLDALEPALEVLAALLALEVTDELSAVPSALARELEEVGPAALSRAAELGAVLEADPALDDEASERRAALALLATYARDGLRALRGEPRPKPSGASRIEPLDDELVGLFQGRFDGLRLAEIARRVRGSSEAEEALAFLRIAPRLASDAPSSRARAGRRERPASGEEDTPEALPLALAAEGLAPMRDPDEGRRVTELELGGRAVELFRFDDGVVAAYVAGPTLLRLGGADVVLRSSRIGYAEATIEPGTRRIELRVGELVRVVELDADGGA